MASAVSNCPPAHHFIALYRSILDRKEQAGDALTQVFLNRRQYDKAREVLEQTIAKHGPGNNDHRKKLLNQITGNWGRFEAAETVPAGTKPKLPLVFRNATEHLSNSRAGGHGGGARGHHRLPEEQSHGARLAAHQSLADRQPAHPGSDNPNTSANPPPPGKASSPRAKNTATPAPHLEVPIDKAGAWWITGKMDNGNEFHTLVWIIDSVLVQRSVGGKLQWWVADADSGAPVSEADIDFFGYRMIYHDRKLPLQPPHGSEMARVRTHDRCRWQNPAQTR